MVNETEWDRKELRDTLKRQAESMFTIPEDYELIIEDLQHDAESGDEGIFTWVKPGTEKGIMVTLSAEGRVLSYTTDVVEAALEKKWSEYELQRIAEQFVKSHYPQALQMFPCHAARWLEDGCLFQYKMTMMELPLPHSGCHVKVSLDGKILDFTYHGEVQLPVVPGSILSAEDVLAHIGRTVNMQLQLQVLSEAVYEGGDNQLHLVYSPAIQLPLLASGEEKPEEDDGEAGQERYVPLPADVLQQIEQEPTVDRTMEEWLGIDHEAYEVVREIDLDEGVTGIVWKRRLPESKGNDRSLNAYFEHQNRDTVKAQVEKQTGRLLGFMRFSDQDEDAEGTSKLSQEECL